MKLVITKQNKKAEKELFVMHILNGSPMFSVDRDNGKIVEIDKKTRDFALDFIKKGGKIR